MAKSKEGQPEGKTAEPKKSSEGGGSKTFMLMFSVAMIVQLIIIVILVYFVLNQSKNNQPVQQTAQVHQEKTEGEHETEGEVKEGAEGESSQKDDGPVIIYQTDDLVINPKGSGGRRYLMTQIGLSVTSEEVKKEFEDSRKAQIYDILNQFLASRSIDELADIERRDSLKIDMKKILNKEISGKKVKNVFFSKFVVQ